MKYALFYLLLAALNIPGVVSGTRISIASCGFCLGVLCCHLANLLAHRRA